MYGTELNTFDYRLYIHIAHEPHSDDSTIRQNQ